MDRYDLLCALNFGHGVSERDSQLDRYFVKTPVFHDVVEDQYDLVLGHKGSGKTAIFKMISDETYPIPQLAAVDVLPAFDLQGDIRFRRLSALSANPSSVEVADSWRAFIIFLVGNHLVDRYSAKFDTTALRESMEVTGMRSPTVKHHHSHHFFARVFDPAPLTMTRPGAADSAGKQPDLDIDPASTATIVDEARELLRTIGRTCWVVFDRLDEAFYESPQLEMMALRELLQVIRDFSSAPDAEIKVKAFLRNDIFQRLSGSNTRLVNMTHILKTQITWPKDVLIDLICRRMAECPEFMEEFGFTADDLENGRKRHYMLSALLPAQVPSGFRHWSGSDTFDWIVTGTAFGGAQYSPRNVLAFLEIARRRQMQWQAINRDVKGGSILSPTSLAHAAAGVSQLRYDDTLLVEFHNLDAHVAKLRGGPAEYESYDALVHRLGLAQDERVSKSVIDELLTSGVIESLPNQRVGVARLYRPALETEADLGGRKSRGA